MTLTERKKLLDEALVKWDTPECDNPNVGEIRRLITAARTLSLLLALMEAGEVKILKREPSDEMADRGYLDADHTLEAMGRDCPSFDDSCKNIYRAMFDAADNYTEWMGE